MSSDTLTLFGPGLDHVDQVAEQRAQSAETLKQLSNKVRAKLENLDPKVVLNERAKIQVAIMTVLEEACNQGVIDQEAVMILSPLLDVLITGFYDALQSQTETPAKIECPTSRKKAKAAPTKKESKKKDYPSIENAPAELRGLAEAKGLLQTLGLNFDQKYDSNQLHTAVTNAMKSKGISVPDDKFPVFTIMLAVYLSERGDFDFEQLKDKKSPDKKAFIELLRHMTKTVAQAGSLSAFLSGGFLSEEHGFDKKKAKSIELLSRLA